MIKFKYDNTDYKLEFNRKTALATEKLGFVVTKLEDIPLNGAIALFKGSFLLNHPMVSEDKIFEIFEKIKDKGELTKALYEEYAVCLSSLAGDDEGNLDWTKE